MTNGESRAHAAANAGDQDHGQQQRTIGCSGRPRARRRIDYTKFHGVGFGLHLTAEFDLLPVGEQFVILILEDFMVAIDPRHLGGNSGLKCLFGRELRHVRLQRVFPRL